jgi:RNA polymerase sigma-70 factor, ECF subfamily
MEQVRDEAGWARALASGDPEATARFYETFLGDVLGWCRRLGGGLLDPEDAAHDVFVVALGRIESFEARSTMRTWMFGVTRRVLANHRRRARTRQLRERLTPHGVLWGQAKGPDPAQATEAAQQQRRVHRCLDSLSPKHREVLVLCSLEGRTGREAAELLGIPEATVYSRLHYARAAFRDSARRFGLVPGDEEDAAHTRGRGGRS